METTKQEQEELLKWLFGNDINIKQEEDITLAPYYEDINIYYTDEIYNLFKTEALLREGKIMQLGSEFLQSANAYHTRLEHSKGSYRNIIQFLSIQYRKPEWREYIEKNKLKGYLVEKIKFMCIHDIGHSMFSHSIEKLVGDTNCTHEDIGRKIVQCNEEVMEALNKIQANEQDSNIEGDGSLTYLCEGNIDFDRMDFLMRDRIYAGREYKDDLILKLNMMCDIEYIPQKKSYEYVYRPEALEYIEDFLQSRIDMYKSEYMSRKRKATDTFMSYLVQEVKNGDIKSTSNIQKFLENIMRKSLEQIDVELFLKTNDIIFLNELISDLEEVEQNELLRYIAHNKQTLLQIAISLLNPQNTSYSEYSKEEQEFLKNLKNLIKNQKSNTKQNIEDIIINAELKEDKRKEIKEKIDAILEGQNVDGIHYYKKTYKKYNKNQPIYIKDKDGKIYKLDEYPMLKLDLSDEYGYGCEVILHQLKKQGVPTEKIEQIKQIIILYQKQEEEIKIGKKESNRMNMFQTQTEEIDYEEKIEEFFPER